MFVKLTFLMPAALDAGPFRVKRGGLAVRDPQVKYKNPHADYDCMGRGQRWSRMYVAQSLTSPRRTCPAAPPAATTAWNCHNLKDSKKSSRFNRKSIATTTPHAVHAPTTTILKIFEISLRENILGRPFEERCVRRMVSRIYSNTHNNFVK